MKRTPSSIYSASQYPNVILAIAVSLCLITVPTITTPVIAQTIAAKVSGSPSSDPIEISSQSCLDAFYAASSQAHSKQTADAQRSLASAIATCQQAITLTLAAGNQWLTAYNLGNLGSLYLRQQNQQQAMLQFEQALAIAQQIDDPILEVTALVALGTAHTQLQQFQPALSFYQQALAVAESVNDANGISIALYNAGLICDALGDYQQAIAAYERAEKTATASGDVILAAYASQKLQLANQAVMQLGATP